jgi:hypothetical protein
LLVFCQKEFDHKEKETWIAKCNCLFLLIIENVSNIVALSSIIKSLNCLQALEPTLNNVLIEEMMNEVSTFLIAL